MTLAWRAARGYVRHEKVPFHFVGRRRACEAPLFAGDRGIRDALAASDRPRAFQPQGTSQHETVPQGLDMGCKRR